MDGLQAWPKWRDRLVLELRMASVPGPKIGEILAEVETHIAETGERPDEAFGDPTDYARSRAEGLAPARTELFGRTIPTFVGGLVAAIGGIAAAGAAWALGAADLRWGPLPTWLVLVIGLAMLYGPLIASRDMIVDPRSGAVLGGGRVAGMAVALSWLVALALVAAAGWYFTG